MKNIINYNGFVGLSEKLNIQPITTSRLMNNKYFVYRWEGDYWVSNSKLDNIQMNTNGKLLKSFHTYKDTEYYVNVRKRFDDGNVYYSIDLFGEVVANHKEININDIPKHYDFFVNDNMVLIDPQYIDELIRKSQAKKRANMTDDDMDKIQKVLMDDNISADIYIKISDPTYIMVEIEGDWKHDHRRADVLVQRLGYKLNRVETDGDGDSDFYKATHYYEK